LLSPSPPSLSSFNPWDSESSQPCPCPITRRRSTSPLSYVEAACLFDVVPSPWSGG
jgi:hypothetical protein